MDSEDQYKLHMRKYEKKGQAWLIQFIKQDRIIMYSCLIFTMLTALCYIYPFAALHEILSILIKSGVNDEPIQTNNLSQLYKYGVLTFVSFALETLFGNINYVLLNIASGHINYKIKTLIVEHLGLLPLGYLNKTSIGSIVEIMEQNVGNIDLFISQLIPQLIQLFFIIIIIFGLFFHYNFVLTLLFMIVFTLAFFVNIYNTCNNPNMELQKAYFDMIGKISSSVIQYIYSIPVVKIYGKSVFSFQKLAHDINIFRKISLEYCYNYRICYCIFTTLLNSCAIFLLPIGTLILFKTEKTVEFAIDFIFFLIVSPFFSICFSNLKNYFGIMDIMKESTNRINTILNEDVIPPPLSPRLPTQFDVSFRHVTFNYKEEIHPYYDENLSNYPSTKNALNDICFEAEKGKITALVGPSGSGKSTIISLIPRFWDVDRGEICIGGVNINDIPYHHLMNIVSFVFQDTFLFNDTIYNNIAIGRPTATREEVIAAAKAAQCHEFIIRLPDEYDTIVGHSTSSTTTAKKTKSSILSNSTNDTTSIPAFSTSSLPRKRKSIKLSGGEQQRICIARAILKNSPILVLDEATAYSDPENAYNIQMALEELVKDKTVIVIAHNLNTVKTADTILVLKDGFIVERGRHESLLNEKGVYYNMWMAFVYSSQWYLSNKQHFIGDIHYPTYNPYWVETEQKQWLENGKFGYQKEGQEMEEKSAFTKIEEENDKSKLTQKIPTIFRHHPSETNSFLEECMEINSDQPRLSRKEGILADNRHLLHNLTFGHPEELYKAIFFSFISHTINLIPTILIVVVIHIVCQSTDNFENLSKIWVISGILVLVMILMFLAEFPSYNYSYNEAYKMTALGRLKIVEHIRRLPLGTLNSKDPGELISLMTNDLSNIEFSISHITPHFYASVILLILTFIIALFIDWRLSLVSFLPYPISILILVMTTSFQDRVTKDSIESKDEVAKCLQEYLRGIQCIKAYNLVGSKFKHLEYSLREVMKSSIKFRCFTSPLISLASTLSFCGFSFLIILGTYLCYHKKLKFDIFVLFLAITIHVYAPLIETIYYITILRTSAVSGKRIQKFLDLPIMKGTTHVVYNPQKDIVFKNVYFKYLSDEEEDEEEDGDDEKNKRRHGSNPKGRSSPIKSFFGFKDSSSSQNHSSRDSTIPIEYTLKNINIRIKQGSLTAIVGPSGSGKSTLLKLIAKFYDIEYGKILFAGEDISKIDPEYYLKNIAMVFQDTYLFQDTIKNNIQFGNSEATNEEIIEAAKKAKAHDFISKLPEGYHTLVGEGGCTLSGGEKQRIAIARAILKEAPVILLDEPSSSLDPENEVEVQRAILELIYGRTVVVITHHLRTIQEADNIIVMDEGYVVEQGTHPQLMRQQGLYHRLWTMQEQL